MVIASHETIITEKLSGIQKNRTVIMPKYGAEMEIWRGQQEGLIIIVNPGIIPGLRKKAGNNWEVANGLRYYTLGKEHSSMW
jgi:hypothetical protein